MKATGMVRRIDDLGRIVIPKEIRRTHKFKVGDELEIYTEDDGLLIMKKHSRIIEFGEVSRGVVESLYRSLGGNVMLADNSHILYASGGYHALYEKKELSSAMQEIIARRRGSILERNNIVDIIASDKHEYSACYVVPIIANGDIYGSLIMIVNDGDIRENVNVLDAAASFLALNLGNE